MRGICTYFDLLRVAYTGPFCPSLCPIFRRFPICPVPFENLEISSGSLGLTRDSGLFEKVELHSVHSIKLSSLNVKFKQFMFVTSNWRHEATGRAKTF